MIVPLSKDFLITIAIHFIMACLLQSFNTTPSLHLLAYLTPTFNLLQWLQPQALPAIPVSAPTLKVDKNLVIVLIMCWLGYFIYDSIIDTTTVAIVVP